MKIRYYNLFDHEYKIEDGVVYYKHISGHWVKSVYTDYEIKADSDFKHVLYWTEKLRERLND